MSRDHAEDAIRALLEARAQAIRDKDADGVFSRCAPDYVRCDLAPPLMRTGADALDRANLIAWFDTWAGPIHYELRDLQVTATGDLAFAHGFVQIGGTKQDGWSGAIWARLTACLAKSGDAWRIAHEHISTPFYMDGSLRAAVDLEPPARH